MLNCTIFLLSPNEQDLIDGNNRLLSINGVTWTFYAAVPYPADVSLHILPPCLCLVCLRPSLCLPSEYNKAAISKQVMSGLGSPSTPSNDEGESRDISNDKGGLLDDPNIVAGERQPTGEDKVKVEEHVQHQSATNKDSESTWENYFLRLLIFREQNGHCMVPSRYSNDPPLGVWGA